MNLFKHASLILLLSLMTFLVNILVPGTVISAGTTSLTITRYNTEGTMVDQLNVDFQTLEALLPVQGDGVTHQYLQGPVFEGDIWDPGETVNIKDWGANRGTDLMDLCELVGGMYPGDVVKIKAVDGLSRTYDYQNVYTPDPRQGKMVVCWWLDGQYVPAWGDGMRLVFFAETPNPDGYYVFGNWDQHECFAPDRWYFYDDQYPTTTGHSVKYINEIIINPPQPSGKILTVVINGSGTVTRNPDLANYTAGTVVNLTATPAASWRFVNWTGAVNSTSPTASVTMDTDKTVTANFEQIKSYNLTVSVTGSGTTTPSAGVYSYPENTVVNLTATPATGWKFVNWTGSVANPIAAITTVTMDSDKAVVANFVQTHKLTVAVIGNGVTSPGVGTYTFPQGSIINLSAAPAQGWQFKNWSGSISSTSPTAAITMNGDKVIQANFIHNCQLTLDLNGSGTTVPAAGVYYYPQGTVVNLSATPADGWFFVNWTGGLASPNLASTSVIMNTDKSISANFDRTETTAEYDLTIAISGSGSINPQTGLHSYKEGSVVNLKATPDNDWKFLKWVGDVADTASPDTTVLVDTDKAVKAYFVQEKQDTEEFYLNVEIEGEGLTTPPAGTYFYDSESEVGISAIPAHGWQFDGWTGDVTDPGSLTTVVDMDSDKEVTACFIPVPAACSLKMEAIGNGAAITIDGAHSYTSGTLVEIAAVPAEGWKFVRWMGNVDDPLSKVTTITVSGDLTVTAEFALISPQPSMTVGAVMPDVKEDSTPVPWYIILAIAGGGLLALVVVVIIIRDIRG